MTVMWSHESLLQLKQVYGSICMWKKPMNLWILYAYMEMFKLVEALWWYGACVVWMKWYRLDSTMAGQQYVNIISEHLYLSMPWGQCLCPCPCSDARGQFQKDNAQPQRSTVASKWLEEHSSKLRFLSWPTNSPYMSIIKHIWDVSQHIIFRRSALPLTSIALCPTGIVEIMEFPTGIMVWIVNWIFSEITWIHVMLSCGISACLWVPYTILDLH